MPAALRHFRFVILIRIGVERNEQGIQKSALAPAARRGAQDRLPGQLVEASECCSRGECRTWRGSTQSDHPSRSALRQRSSLAQRCFLVALLSAHYRGNVTPMGIAQSRITAQGQISVPAEIRKKLGVGPGSVLEWHEQDDHVVVRRAARYSSQDIHRELFPEGTSQAGPADVKAGIRKHVRKRHARR